MTTSPKVAFIIVAWNNADLLPECFLSIQEQAYRDHVTVLVANGSKDDTVAMVKDKYPWVEVVEAYANLGFAKGNNIGIRYALERYPELEYCVFLNTDARMRHDWLNVMLDFAKQKPKLALAQSMTLDYYDHQIMDSTHIYISQQGAGTQSGWRMPFRGYKGPRKVFGVNAAAAIVSCNFIQAQPYDSLLDETLFMYLEDVDLAARATIMGWDCYSVSGTEAYHMGSASSGKNPGYSLYMTYRNNIAVLYKNLPFSLLLKMIPKLIISDYRTIKHLRTLGKGHLAGQIIKGRVVGLVRLPLFVVSAWRLRHYRRTIDKTALWSFMQAGE